MTRGRLVAVLPLLFGAALVGTGVTGALRAAQADTAPLSVYSLFGDATGFVSSEDEPSANAHPEGQASVPESSTLLANGPVGYGLSAVGWPGATVGNAGDVVILLFPGPLTSQGVPVPDAVTAAVDQAAPSSNYPVRAEARTGVHPDGSYSAPGTSLTAHADTAKVNAVADLQSARQSGGASFGNMHTDSTSTLTGSVGRVTASSVVSDISIAGALKIGSVTSTATGQTNGTTSFGTGSTIVSDMTIGGQPAYVDESGVHFGKPGVPANAIVNQIAQQALSGAGMHIVVTKPQLVTKGASSTYTAGSLLVVWAPPGDSSKNVFVTSLGGARVAVSGALGSLFSVPTTPTLPSSTSPAPVTPAPSSPAPPLVVSTPSLTTSSPSVVSSPGTATAPRPASRPTTILGLRLARTFRGIKAGWSLLALAGVGLLFAGSRRLADDLLDRPTGTCPLENPRA